MPLRALRLALIAALAMTPATGAALERFTVEVLERKAQSRDNFVQGLEIHDDQLYVSTGNFGHSRLLRYRLADMQLQAGRKLHPRVFGEGMTVLGDTVYQLTWQNQMLLLYDRDSLDYQRFIRLPGEGWGLTNNGSELIYTDSGSQLHFIDPVDGRRLHSVDVTFEGRPLPQINELEWIDGRVWANVWRTDNIVVIDPGSGRVEQVIDLAGLLPAEERQRGTDVLNGIARNPANGDLWVTGKHWPWLYRVRLVPDPDKPPKAADSR